MNSSYDVIVVGLGAMGSAISFELAGRGVQVLGLDANDPPHALGSSHGRSRIIREAYFEDPRYVPLLQRAYERWADLERMSRTRLLVRTGGLMIGPADGTLMTGSRASVSLHDLTHELLDADAIRRRWPVLRPREDMIGLLEPRAGVLLPEACVKAHLDLAREHGATLATGRRATRWSARDGAVAVWSSDGTRYDARRLVLAAGPWLPELLELPLGLEVERQLFHWFEPHAHGDAFAATQCPITLWEYDTGRWFATIPDLGDGLKIGIHHEGEPTDPHRVQRTPTTVDEAAVRALLSRWMPAANGRLREARVCLYTNTPDHHFLIDHHPAAPEVVLVSPCSGHGFKFASVIGEVVADLATGREPRVDLRLFRVERLLARSRARFAPSAEAPDIA